MPHPDYRTCRECGKHQPEPGMLSWTRLCPECSAARYNANNDQIHAGSGPFHEHRLRRILLSAHRALVAARDESA